MDNNAGLVGLCRTSSFRCRLATAARDTLQSNPDFAWRVSLLAVKYLLVDYVDVSEHDVITAAGYLVEGARNAGSLDEAPDALQQVLDLRKKAQKIPRIVREELKRLGVSSLMQCRVGSRPSHTRGRHG